MGYLKNTTEPKSTFSINKYMQGLLFSGHSVGGLIIRLSLCYIVRAVGVIQMFAVTN